jgi:AraC-like DNA-binding protein
VNQQRCGAHIALRSSQFCAVWRYQPRLDHAACEGDKTFVMHSIGYQMMGGWTFHGKKRPMRVDRATVIAGSPGQHYGCKHAATACDIVCAISLLPGALDDADRELFDAQVLDGLALPALERSLAIEDDDRFESFIFEIFDHVSRASRRGGTGRNRADFRVQRIKRFIERHAYEDIALGDIAACLDLSPFTCLRLFKSRTGVTPLRYLSRLRLERAQALLKDRRLTIPEVARAVGIRDRAYFTRWFSKEAGIPPHGFRQSVLQRV